MHFSVSNTYLLFGIRRRIVNYKESAVPVKNKLVCACVIILSRNLFAYFATKEAAQFGLPNKPKIAYKIHY